MDELTLREHIGATVNTTLTEINAVTQKVAIMCLVIRLIWALA